MEITNDIELLLDQSNGAIGLIECLEISHSKFDKVYRFVINSNFDMNMRHEDGNIYTYTYAPIQITRSVDADTLEQTITFFFAELGDVLPRLIDLFIDDEDIELPVLSYRAYVTDSYDSPIFVTRNLLITSITRDWQGSRVDSEAPSLNENGNGEVYSASTDPSLIGFY